jgi:hypothetical protein
MSVEAKRPERRGLLKALGLGAGVAAAGAAQAQRSDSVPARDARRENEAQRLAPRYQPSSAYVQAFYRTNRYEH